MQEVSAAVDGSPEVWIELQNRVAAVTLMQRLARHGSYLIQRSHEQWIVHARCPDERVLDEVVERVEEWDRSRDYGQVTVHHRDRAISVPRH